MIVYEFPLNEHVRTLLKLERLFQQALHLIRLDDTLSHQSALFALLDLLELTARHDIKSDLLMDLFRMRQQDEAQTAPHAKLSSETTALIEQTLAALHGQPSRFDQPLREQEWLVAIKQRMNITGGVNSFDVPHFHYWQHSPAAQRRADLVNWIAPMLHIYHALTLVLHHLRENSLPQALIAQQGFHQQMLNGRSGQLLRIGLAKDEPVLPETSASRHAINIRFLSLENGNHTRCDRDIEFQLCFCAP